MTASRNAQAWRVLCQRWQHPAHWFESALGAAERGAHEHLLAIKAVTAYQTNLQFALCGHCGLHTAPVYREGGAMRLHCPDCGPVSLSASDLKAYVVDDAWLIRKLRAALDIPVQQDTVPIAPGVWRAGTYQRRPVLLARRLDLILQKPAALARTRTAAPAWLITPKPPRDVDADPLAGQATWLPMQERFTLYGGNLHLIEPGQQVAGVQGDERVPVHGPFSEDFRWVWLDGEAQPIELSAAQAAVFKTLWDFGGQPQVAHLVMSRAGLASDKPVDVFKVKAQHKEDACYEGPLRAYKALIKTNRRAGTYALPCAGHTNAAQF